MKLGYGPVEFKNFKLNSVDLCLLFVLALYGICYICQYGNSFPHKYF